MIIALFKSLRPRQWTKNLLVFAGYIFTINQTHPPGTPLRVLAAFGLFCAVAGATYIINDAADAERDRKHPRKRNRPIASGAVTVRAAVTFAALLLATALWLSYILDLGFGLLVTAYLLLSIAYSTFLKHVVIVDLMAIAAGFVIRAASGAVVIHVMISPWLLVCTTLLALFLGLAKRRGELANLDKSHEHRRTLGQYTAPMLDQMLTISAAACLMGYFLYT
ncbi:MAG: decaprenyl-phosphate phosphoribosyltransferase, partial [Armatimonadetes bacterium]|nr:decaprenyl-phosphate phosphoribosyltransferase [Armatimonadota bacterium]